MLLATLVTQVMCLVLRIFVYHCYLKFAIIKFPTPMSLCPCVPVSRFQSRFDLRSFHGGAAFQWWTENVGRGLTALYYHAHKSHGPRYRYTNVLGGCSAHPTRRPRKTHVEKYVLRFAIGSTENKR